MHKLPAHEAMTLAEELKQNMESKRGHTLQETSTVGFTPHDPRALMEGHDHIIFKMEVPLMNVSSGVMF